MKVLVVDVVGSQVKCVATDQQRPVEFESGPMLTPDRMVRNVPKITKGRRFDAVSIGHPGVVRRAEIVREPRNPGSGWVGFNLQEGLGCPVKTMALLPAYIVLGGRNVANLKRLPPQTRRGDNAHAFAGGFRFWERQDCDAAASAGIGWAIADGGDCHGPAAVEAIA